MVLLLFEAASNYFSLLHLISVEITSHSFYEQSLLSITMASDYHKLQSSFTSTKKVQRNSQRGMKKKERGRERERGKRSGLVRGRDKGKGEERRDEGKGR